MNIVRLNLFIFIILAFFITFASAQSQQIKIKTQDTQNIENGTCQMNIGSQTIQGIIKSGVCTLPYNSEVSPISSPIPTPIFLEQIGIPKEVARPISRVVENLNTSILQEGKSFSDVSNNLIPVNEQTKTITKSFVSVGSTVATATVVVPVLFISTSPHIFFSSLILIAGKKRSKPWGIVFDSTTDQPIPFAVIRLFEAKTNSFLKDTVTDLQGRFSFIADKGQYYLDVKSVNYESLEKKNYMLDSDIYLGEIFDIYEENVSLGMKIPLNPLAKKSNILQSIKIKYKVYIPKIIRITVLILFLVSLYQFYFSSTFISIGLSTVYLILYLYLIYNKNKYDKSFGFIYNSISNKPAGSVFIKLRDKKTRNLVTDLVITDKKGRFSLIANEGDYDMELQGGNMIIDKVDGSAQIISPNKLSIFYKIKSKLKVGMK